jgi:hypothetical protein
MEFTPVGAPRHIVLHVFMRLDFIIMLEILDARAAQFTNSQALTEIYHKSLVICKMQSIDSVAGALQRRILSPYRSGNQFFRPLRLDKLPTLRL